MVVVDAYVFDWRKYLFLEHLRSSRQPSERWATGACSKIYNDGMLWYLACFFLDLGVFAVIARPKYVCAWIARALSNICTDGKLWCIACFFLDLSIFAGIARLAFFCAWVTQASSNICIDGKL